MNASAPFIRRPIATTLCMLSVLLFGMIGYRLLPVSDLPNIDFPTIQVNASYPGANPDTMSSTVATPLEKEFSTIAGIDSMTSSSSQGSTQIVMQFVLDRSIDAAAQDVQAAISRAARRLPSDMPNPPSFRKVNPADSPILFLTLTAATLSMSALDDLAQTTLAQRISMVNGVAQVQVFGSQKYAVRIQLDPRAMAYRGIGIDEVADVIARNNVNLPLGTLSGPSKIATVEADGQLTEASQYLPMIVAYRDGKPVRLAGIGDALDSVENDKNAAWYHTPPTYQRAIILAVQRQPGTNTVAVARAVRNLLPMLRDKLPPSVTLGVLRDGSTIIEKSARDVQFTLLLTLTLVVMVIFLFLRNLSATVIPSLTLPMSIVGTFAGMYLLGYNLDNLSLMALTLSVGFVVDDAIVMLENIVRHMEMGKSRLQAALEGSREIGFTIVSMTLSLAAVFIPVLFMGGIVGRLFREFSVTIGLAVLISGAVSLTLTPMLCSRFLRAPSAVVHGAAYRLAERAFQAMLRFYDRSLWKVLRRRGVVLLFSAAVLAATGLLFVAIPKGFIPSEDRDQIMVQTETAQDASFEVMRAGQLKLADIVGRDENVERFMSHVGGNNGRMFLVLKPRGQRKLTADEVITELRTKLMSVPGMRVFLTNLPPINVGARMGRSLYQVTLQAADTDDLNRYAADLEERMRGMTEFLDISSDLQLRNPLVRVEMDRDRAVTMGLTPLQIETALNAAYGSREVSTILTPDNQYSVIMEVAPEFQADASMLSTLYVRSSHGPLVPLKAVTRLHEEVGPLSINHSGQLPSVTISFNLKPGVSLGAAIDVILATARATMPSGMAVNFQGTAQAFLTSMGSMGWLLVLAIVVIYVVLGILYESFHHPITILSALPFAGFGALLTLLVFGEDLSIYSFVGVIMLVGLVKKNGIMMVDFAIEAQRKEGKTPLEAIHEACMIRFRPIMMTTMAALMAGLPLALGLGAGAESRRPLGLAVVGGLLFSQTLTLFVTPVFYVTIDRLRARLGRRTADVTPDIRPAATEAL